VETAEDDRGQSTHINSHFKHVNMMKRDLDSMKKDVDSMKKDVDGMQKRIKNMEDDMVRERRYRRRETLETTFDKQEFFLKAVWDEVNGREPEPDPMVERYKSVHHADTFPI
jgi:predicted  nucleic acid-binding Zn-ribbon protein